MCCFQIFWYKERNFSTLKSYLYSLLKGFQSFRPECVELYSALNNAIVNTFMAMVHSVKGLKMAIQATNVSGHIDTYIECARWTFQSQKFA